MATDCITQVTFQGDGFGKPVVARFDQPEASTDGGLVLLKALDTQLGLTARLAACLDDVREPGKVRHETVELLQQRIFGLCAGHADCNDAVRLVHDPIHTKPLRVGLRKRRRARHPSHRWRDNPAARCAVREYPRRRSPAETTTPSGACRDSRVPSSGSAPS